MNMSESRCFMCLNGNDVKPFNLRTLQKCKDILKLRIEHNYQYKDVELPYDVTTAVGYHSKPCYKNFTAFRIKLQASASSSVSTDENCLPECNHQPKGILEGQKDEMFCFSYTQSNEKSQNGSIQSQEHQNKYRFTVETMSRDNIRDQVLDLINQKEKIENDIKNLTSILSQNRVGMNDPLVDNEGFPIASIDIHQVRYARHHIIRLQNDHKNLMKQIENGLHEFHSNASADGTCQAMPMSVDVPNLVVHKTPFAKVTVVSEGSPADYAGMSTNDEIVEFGSVNVSNFKNITDIATVVQHAVGVQVNVKLKRGDRFLTVQLVPRAWRGKGLLGCNIVPL